MTDRELLEKMLEKITSIDSRLETVEGKIATVEKKMATKQDVNRLEGKIDDLASITQKDVKGILEHVKDKTELLPQIDERLESVEDDINYLAKKSVKYGTEIGKLKKTYKKNL